MESRDMTFGKNVKLTRIENDLTTAEFAAMAGCARQTIGLIEGERFSPSLKLCIALAKALTRTPDDLYWIEEKHHDER
jgi:putative transcriptional regulator